MTTYTPLVGQINHETYPKSLKDKTPETLRAIIADCKAAIAANPDAEKVRSGYYEDEICYCADELNKRKAQRARTARAFKDDAMRSCGLVKVRGALGGTYWE